MKKKNFASKIFMTALIIVAISMAFDNMGRAGAGDECTEYYVNWEGLCKQKYDCEPLNGQTGFCGQCKSRVVDMSLCNTQQDGTPSEGEGGSSTVDPEDPGDNIIASGYSSVNNFELSWVDKPTKAVAGQSTTMKINVENAGTNFGSMKVQCSILDPGEHDWLLSIKNPVLIDNCVANEPFTQTKIVELAEGQDIDVSYTVTAPEEKGTYRLYCAAYEYCYSPERDPLVSDELKSTNIEVTGEECTETTAWMELLNKECVDGKVVSLEKEEKEPFDFQQWRKDNKLTIIVFFAVIFIIYMVWSFEEKPKMPANLNYYKVGR